MHDLHDTNTAIGNLCSDSSAIDSSAIGDNAKIPASTTDRSGHMTLGEIKGWIKGQLYTDYVGEKTFTQNDGLTLAGDFLYKRIEIGVAGAKNSDTMTGNLTINSSHNGWGWSILLNWYDSTISSFTGNHYLSVYISTTELIVVLGAFDTWTSQDLRYHIRVWN